jgi:hypothetical protein
MTLTRQKPRDIVEYVRRLEERVSILERAPRLGNASIDSGQLTVKGGDIVVTEADGTTRVMEILHGSIPRINMYPIGDGGEDFKLTSFGWESAEQGAAFQLGVEKVDTGQDGGKLLLMNRAVYLSLLRDDSPEVFIALGAIEDYPEHYWFKGRFMNGVDVTDSDALVVGQMDVAGGAASATFTYAVPKLTAMVPVVTLECTTIMEWQVTVSSATSFTVDWSNDTPAKKINFWAFRI